MLVVDSHQLSETVVISWLNDKFVCVVMVGEHVVENLISAHSVLDLINKFLVSFVSTVSFGTIVQVVHLDIT